MKEQPKELMACPFCKCEQIWVDPSNSMDSSNGKYQPVCQGCGYSIGFYQTEAEAIAAWNHRAPAPGVLLSDGERLTDALAVYADLKEQGFTTDLPETEEEGTTLFWQERLQPLFDALEAAQARLANAATDSWQGIETAPKDGTDVWIWGTRNLEGPDPHQKPNRYIARWHGNGWSSYRESYWPQLWQPLPSPPKANP